MEPQGTILRSNHVSNFLNLAGSYPKDRQRLIEAAAAALVEAKRQPAWYADISSQSEGVLLALASA